MTVVDEHIKALEDALFLNDSTELKRAVENTIGVFSGNIDGLIKGLDRGRVKAIPISGSVSSNPLRYQQSAESGTASQRAWYPG